MAKKAKAFTHKPAAFPSRQCPSCGKWYHARAKECPECGTANPSRGSVSRKVKKVKRRVGAARPGAGRPAAGHGGGALEAAIEFVQAAGGIEQAKAALETIEIIRGL